MAETIIKPVVPAINLKGLFPGAAPGLMDVMGQLQKAQDAANIANEQRYQDILGLYGNLGKTGETRIGETAARQQAIIAQNLASRGLGNTTIMPSISRGIASDAALQRQQLAENVAMQRAGVMERRTDQGPNMGLYASLLMAAAQGQSAPVQIGGGGRSYGAGSAGLQALYERMQPHGSPNTPQYQSPGIGPWNQPQGQPQGQPQTPYNEFYNVPLSQEDISYLDYMNK